MPSAPIIHRSIDRLRSQLKKLEPRKIHRRIGVGFTQVHAVDYLEFDPNIPILKERHLKQKQTGEKQPIERQEGKKPQKEERIKNTHVIGETSGDRHLDERPLKRSHPDEKHVDEPPLKECNANESPPADEGRLDESYVDEGSHERSLDEESTQGEKHLLEDDEPAQDSSFVDRLILTGPEEDEFRQYDDDDEEETVISRNRKKISSEAITKEKKQTSNPLARPYPPVQPARTAAQPNGNQQPLRESPRQDQSGQLVPKHNGTTQQPAQMVPPKEVTIADVNKYLEQKNLLVVHKELEQHMNTLPQEDVRLTLRKAIFLCFERDETFMLLKFIKLVFEVNYNNDPKFWDELIGKLRRKNNPHAKCISFRSEIDPRLVLQNYQSIIKQIGEYFERTNPTLTLPWLTFVYIRDACKPPPPPPSAPAPVQSTSVPAIEGAKATHPAITPEHATAQENLNPEKQRHVLEISTGINKKEFRITIPRRQATFSSKLLVRKLDRPTP